MDKITDYDKMDAPSVDFADLPTGMGEEIEIGDTLVCKKGDEEEEAHVIEVDRKGGKVYLSKKLKGGEYSVKETSTGSVAPFEAMKKQAQDSSEKVLKGPLPDLKKLLIEISISQE